MIRGRDGKLKPVAMLPDPAELPQKGEPGRDGVSIPGPPGPGFQFDGEWKKSKAPYPVNSVVTYQGSTYLVLKPSKLPPSKTNKAFALWAAKGERGEKGVSESWLYQQRIGAKPQPSGAEISHPLSFPALFGQAVTVSGLASMVSPKVIGVCDSSTTYRTEGPIVFDADILTPGATYFLDATVPGQISSVAPTVDGHFVVVIGRALDSRTLDIEVSNPVLL